MAAHLISAWAEHGSLHLHHVLVAVQCRIHAHRVFVHQLEVVQVELTHVEHGVHLACLAVHADGLCIGIASETSGITQQGGCTLCLLHLVEHRALDLSRDVYQCFVGTYGHDVIVLQPDITRQMAVQQEVIDIDTRQQTAVAIHLDVSQRTELIRAASHVEGVIDGRESRQGIGARHLHLTDHADGDGACLTERQFDV